MNNRVNPADSWPSHDTEFTNKLEDELHLEAVLERVFYVDAKNGSENEALAKLCTWINASLESGKPVRTENDIEQKDGYVTHSLTGINGFDFIDKDLDKKNYKLGMAVSAEENLNDNLVDFLEYTKNLKTRGFEFTPNYLSNKFSEAKESALDKATAPPKPHRIHLDIKH